jgi:hypothetical protein
MTEPDPIFEKKVLLDVVKQMQDVEATERQQATMKKAALGLGSAGLTVAFIIAFHPLGHPVAVAAVAGMAGAVAGFGLFLDFSHRQWPITRRYIDMDSVRARLAELETPR